jgi:intracellular septation protein
MPDQSPSQPPRHLNPVLKLALEFGPLAAFFVANSRLGILHGTMVFMAATAAALALSYVLLRRVPIMPLVSGFFVLVFGGLTVLLADDLFIKLKPTIINTCFAAILFFGLRTNRLFVKLLFEAALHLTDHGWRLFTRAWIGFFLFLAVINEIVWRNFSTDAWVDFKVFGVMPLTFVFTLALMPMVLKHAIPEGQQQPEEPL